MYSKFTASGKPVFHIEYPLSAPASVSTNERNADCNPAGVTGLSTVMKNQTLGGWVAYCDGSYITTPVDDSGGNGGGGGGNNNRPPPGPKTTARRTSTTRQTSTLRTSTSRTTSTVRTSTSRSISTSQRNTSRPSSTARPPTTNPRPPATTSRSTSTTHSSTTTSRTTTSSTEAPHTTFPIGPSRTSSSQTSRTSSSAGSSSSGNGCKSKHYDQCGGNDWKGCTECEVSFSSLLIPPHPSKFKPNVFISPGRLQVQRDITTLLLPMSMRSFLLPSCIYLGGWGFGASDICISGGVSWGSHTLAFVPNTLQRNGYLEAFIRWLGNII
jgi:hypothetical protein